MKVSTQSETTTRRQEGDALAATIVLGVVPGVAVGLGAMALFGSMGLLFGLLTAVAGAGLSSMAFLLPRRQR